MSLLSQLGLLPTAFTLAPVRTTQAAETSAAPASPCAPLLIGLVISAGLQSLN